MSEEQRHAPTLTCGRVVSHDDRPVEQSAGRILRGQLGPCGAPATTTCHHCGGPVCDAHALESAGGWCGCDGPAHPPQGLN